MGRHRTTLRCRPICCLGGGEMLKESGKRGSNPRPSAWEADALPTELLPQIEVVSLLALLLYNNVCVVRFIV